MVEYTMGENKQFLSYAIYVYNNTESRKKGFLIKDDD